MPSVKDIVDDIKSTFGSSLINATQAAKYLGMAKDKRGRFLADIPVYPTGKEIKYHAIDIAQRLEKIRTYRPYG